jgi:hypothetical protein
MTKFIALHLQTNPFRTDAVERAAPKRIDENLSIIAAWVLIATRDDEEVRYRVEDIICIEATPNERSLLIELDNVLSELDEFDLPPFLLGFGSASFDVPLLRLRAMRHSLPLKCFGMPGEGRYEKLRMKAPRQHVDVAREVFGYRHCSIDDASRALGMPTRNYGLIKRPDCERDETEARAWSELTLLALWLIFLRWSLVTNSMSVRGFDVSFGNIIEFVCQRQDSHPHLSRWLDAYSSVAARARRILNSNSFHTNV